MARLILEENKRRARTRRFEGGLNLKEVGGGGVSNKGITQDTYNAFRKRKNLTEEDVTNIEDEEVDEIYDYDFYEKPKINTLPKDTGDIVFDYGLNASPRKAIKDLQEVVGSESDGLIGNETRGKVNEYIEKHGEKKLLDDVLKKREAHNAGLIENNPDKYGRFKKGWQNRIDSFRKEFDISALNPFSVKEAEASSTPKLVLDKPNGGPRLVIDKPSKSIIQEGKEVVTELSKAALRGFENLFAGMGATTRWIGENISEGVPARLAKGIISPLEAFKEQSDFTKNLQEKVGDQLSRWGENAYNFWRKEAQRGIEAPDIKTFQGSFMQNPSWTRGVATVAEAIPSLAGATVIGIATGNPLAGAASLGILEGSGQYVEAREAGKDVAFANVVGGLSVLGNTALEVIPLTRFVKGGAGKLWKDIFIGAIQEGLEEVLQALWSNIIAKVGYDKTRNLTEGMIEGFIGGAGSGGVLGGLTSGRGIQTDKDIQEAIDKGVAPEQINAMQEAVKNQIVDNADKIEDELGKLNLWLEKRKSTIRPVLFEETPKPEVSEPVGELTPEDVRGYNKDVRDVQRQARRLKIEPEAKKPTETPVEKEDLSILEPEEKPDVSVPLEEQAKKFKTAEGAKFGKRYDEDTKNKIIDLYSKGKSSRQIAEELNVSSSAILNIVDKSGIKRTISESTAIYSKDIPKVIELYKQGESTGEIAKKMGISKSSVARWIKNAEITRTPSEAQGVKTEDIIKAIDLYKGGKSTIEIGKELGYSKGSIWRWVKDVEENRSQSEARSILAEEGRLNLQSVKSSVQTKFGEIKADSAYEAARIKQLEKEENIISIKRAKRIPFGDKSYIPDLEIEYSDGKIVIEEIKAHYKATDEKVLAKQKAAQEYYKDKNIEYRIVTENDIGINAFSDIKINDLKFIKEQDKVRFNQAIKSVKAILSKQQLTDIFNKAKGEEVITDPARVQEIKNSIQEGELILKSGKDVAGKKMTPEALEGVKRSIESARKKIGEVKKRPSKGGTAGGAAAAVGAAKGQGYGGIIEPSEKSSKVKVAKSDYAKIAEDVPAREETNIIKEFLKISAPTRVSGATEEAGLTLRKELATLAHKDVLAIEGLKKAHSAFTWMSDADSHAFMDSIEQGKPQGRPELQPFADAMRKLLDDRREAIRELGKGQLEGYYENYFPHIWKDPNKAKDIVMQIMGRKQLQGTKSFLKKRVIVSIKDGLDRGLELVSDNPVDLVLLKLHEMDRYLMSQNIIRDLKGKGLAKFVYARGKKPEGYSRVNDNAFTVFMPPEITKKEAFDSIMVEQLMDSAQVLGIDTKRFVSIGGKRWGFARWWPGQEKGEQIRTKFAGPESVLAHEIGHVIGVRYKLYDLLGKRKEGEVKVHKAGKKAGEEFFKPTKEAVDHRRVIDKQWRDLADARFQGLKASPGYKSYVRKSREKEAVLLEAYLHAPEEFKRIAPDLYKGFVSFMNEHGELRPILDIKPSLVLGEADAKIKIPGFTTLGHYYAPTDVARLINNHLSPGLRNADNKLISSSYNILRGAGNVLNQVNLSLSGFHALNVSTDMMASTIGLGLRKLTSRGQALSGIMDILMFPLAPIQGIWQGSRVKKAYRQEINTIKDPKLKNMVEAIVAAGGRDRMDIFYYNQQVKALTETFRDVLKGTGVEKLTGIAKLPFNVFGATLETLAKPIMEWYVPTGKLGLFAKLAEHEMARAESGEISTSQLVGQLASVWDSVDNRMGQLIYDNLFWNKAMKDGLMLAIRSVGWNLGSWREYAGAGVDLATVGNRMKKGDKILSHKMSYAIGAAVVYSILGSVIQYLLTGKPPEEPKDYFFPKTGRKNSDGSDERLSLPTYAKDIYAYSQRPFKTIKNKAHPLIGLLDEQFKNKDYYKTQIADPKDPIYTQILDRAKHIVKFAKPFSFKNYEKMKRIGETGPTSLFVSITGIASAPAYVTKSEAQKLMSRYIVDRIPDNAKTKEEFEKSEYRRSLKSRIRKGERIDYQEALNVLGRKSLQRLVNDSKFPPFSASFKRLSVEEALNVYAIATPKEKRQSKILLVGKFRRAHDDGKVTPYMMSMFKELMK